MSPGAHDDTLTRFSTKRNTLSDRAIKQLRDLRHESNSLPWLSFGKAPSQSCQKHHTYHSFGSREHVFAVWDKRCSVHLHHMPNLTFILFPSALTSSGQQAGLMRSWCVISLMNVGHANKLALSKWMLDAFVIGKLLIIGLTVLKCIMRDPITNVKDELWKKSC